MNHYCYVTTNLINNKQYVGVSKVKTKPYYGSGKLINNAIKKYGVENFKVEILEWFDDRELALNKEIEYINSLNTKVPNGYNIVNKRIYDRFGFKITEETRLKIKNKTPWNKGKTMSIFQKKKISLSRTGKNHTDETKQKMVINRQHITLQTKEKMSISHTGKKRSQEVKLKMSIAQKIRRLNDKLKRL